MEIIATFNKTCEVDQTMSIVVSNRVFKSSFFFLHFDLPFAGFVFKFYIYKKITILTHFKIRDNLLKSQIVGLLRRFALFRTRKKRRKRQIHSQTTQLYSKTSIQKIAFEKLHSKNCIRKMVFRNNGQFKNRRCIQSDIFWLGEFDFELIQMIYACLRKSRGEINYFFTGSWRTSGVVFRDGLFKA